MEIAVGIICFLTGALITALAYNITYAGKLATMAANIENISSKVNYMCDQTEKLEKRISNVSERVTRLETAAGIKMSS
jgi:septal ring factor EnvC (AmiA/AmiB activator)